MEFGDFLGIFSIRGRQHIFNMPAHNESGLWQAWRTPDASFLVQALDRERHPHGTIFSLSADDFNTMLAPTAPEPEAEQRGDALFVRSDAPDLLGMWYEQTKDGPDEPGEDEPEVELPSQPPAPPRAAAPVPGPKASGPLPGAGNEDEKEPREPVDPDSLLFLPLEHPDDLLPDEKPAPPTPPRAAASRTARTGAPPPATPTAQRVEQRTPPPAQARAAAPQAARAGTPPPAALTAQRVEQRTPPPTARPAQTAGQGPAQKAAPAPKAAATAPAPARPQASLAAALAAEAANAAAPSGPRSLALELQAKRVEDHMRGEFKEIIARMDETANPELEQRMGKLLSMSAAFGPSQKFMFTEFGLALRKKRKHQLALLCHLRALHYAPDDEHILFNVARAEYALGDRGGACENLEKALSIQPGFTLAADFLRFLRGPVTGTER